MINTLLGTKGEMAQVFDVDGNRWAGTWIKTGPCVITQVKNKEKDGYGAVQIGYGNRKHGVKPLMGHLKKANIEKAVQVMQEIRVDGSDMPVLGSEIKAGEIFEVGDKVMVTGMSKGKGFAGVVKRWGFAGGPKTHGQSDRHRAPGSIGAGTDPGRVLKGKKMAGRMGRDTVSVKGLTILNIDGDMILVSGPVPGSIETLLRIMKVGKGKKIPELITKRQKNEKTEEQALGALEGSEGNDELDEKQDKVEMQNDSEKSEKSENLDKLENQEVG